MIFVYGTSLAMTIVIEGTIAFLLGVRSIRGQLSCALVQILTNPLLISVLNLMAMDGVPAGAVTAAMYAMELSLVPLEGMLFARLLEGGRTPFGNPYAFATALNAISFGIGELVNLS